MKHRALSAFLSLILMLGLLVACDGGEGGGITTGGDTTIPSTEDPAVSDSSADTEGDEPAVDTFKGILLNIDINTVTWPFLAAVGAKESVTEADLYPFVDQYADTQVTDLLFNIFCQFSATPSEVMTDAIERHHELNSSEPQAYWNPKHIAHFYEDLQIDPYEVWIRRTQEKGMKAWISLRMNDCHEPDNLNSFLHGDLFHEAIEKGWVLGKSYGHQKYCLDYSVPEVREYMLDYTREQLLRYDVDGIELDFSREMTCFKLNDGKDHVAIMNQYLRDTAAIVKEAEEKWGHDIEVTIRLMRDIEQSKKFGFDAETMVSEKLVDSITVCPRWATNDSDMPIDEWTEAFPEIEIYGAVTDLTYNKSTPNQVVAAYASQFFHQGASKLYLYNFFCNPLTPDEATNKTYRKIYESCGDLATLTEAPRRYIVTYQDVVPKGYTAWKPLPAQADGFKIEIVTGDLSGEDKFWLVVGVDQKLKKEDLIIKINGQEIAFKSMTRFSATFAGNTEQYRYSIPAEYIQDGIQSIEMRTANTSLMLKYLEFTAGINMG